VERELSYLLSGEASSVEKMGIKGKEAVPAKVT
jgi:hypothetical protein